MQPDPLRVATGPAETPFGAEKPKFKPGTVGPSR
jgi:hypothetical protein